MRLATTFLLLTVLTVAAHAQKPQPVESVAGTYAGTWASDKYDVSGALVMLVKFTDGTPEVTVNFTGSEYLNHDTLIARFTSIGDNAWRMDYKGKKSKVSGTGLFVEGAFVGDYKFSKLLWTDRGKWKLER